MNEARYSSLTRAFPERAKELFARNEEAAKERYEHLTRLRGAVQVSSYSTSPGRLASGASLFSLKKRPRTYSSGALITLLMVELVGLILGLAGEAQARGGCR